jgi:hypothetical protein
MEFPGESASHENCIMNLEHSSAQLQRAANSGSLCAESPKNEEMDSRVKILATELGPSVNCFKGITRIPWCKQKVLFELNTAKACLACSTSKSSESQQTWTSSTPREFNVATS